MHTHRHKIETSKKTKQDYTHSHTKHKAQNSHSNRTRAPKKPSLHTHVSLSVTVTTSDIDTCTRLHTGHIRVVKRAVLLCRAACAVDGAAQNCVRVAPKARWRAAHRRRLAQPRFVAPPGQLLQCASSFLGMHVIRVDPNKHHLWVQSSKT